MEQKVAVVVGLGYVGLARGVLMKSVIDSSRLPKPVRYWSP